MCKMELHCLCGPYFLASGHLGYNYFVHIVVGIPVFVFYLKAGVTECLTNTIHNLGTGKSGIFFYCILRDGNNPVCSHITQTAFNGA